MKRVMYYFYIAIVAFIEVLVFAWSVEAGEPMPTIIAVVIGIAMLYIGRSYVDEVTGDERTQKINEITALRTLQITWVVLFLYALWVILEAFSMGINHYNRVIGAYGFRMMFFLCCIILVYVILSLYYNKKYGA
ncbi:MAG TPA: DUF2178 domain-containing protein [Methanoregulaceae archaeon]|nr:DUF2178 domain-containing protein [Methanoregulaceae archaeon]